MCAGMCMETCTGMCMGTGIGVCMSIDALLGDAYMMLHTHSASTLVTSRACTLLAIYAMDRNLKTFQQ